MDAHARLEARVARVRKSTATKLQHNSRQHIARASSSDGALLRARLKDAETKNRELVAVARRVNSELHQVETRRALELRDLQNQNLSSRIADTDADVNRSRALVRKAEHLNQQLQLQVCTGNPSWPR